MSGEGLRDARVTANRTGTKGFLMSDSTKDRISGLADQAKGNVKEGVGKATGDKDLENEGLLDQAKGHVKEGVADVKDKVDDLVKSVTGKDDESKA
jgi:uncharacterized protein YjbJ (UPF0337 family)